MDDKDTQVPSSQGDPDPGFDVPRSVGDLSLLADSELDLTFFSARTHAVDTPSDFDLATCISNLIR